jgi:hypothetical protein
VTVLHNLYFHSWHWIFQQVQLDNWFGNIVAGVIGYVAGGRKLLRDPKLHEKLDHIIHYHPDIPDMEDK